MSPAEPHERRRCPVCAADAARPLLSAGRASMALPVLDGLPGLTEDAIVAVWVNGVEHGHAAAPEARAARPKAVPSGPAGGRRAFAVEKLARHFGRLGGGRVAELLGVRLDDLGPLLEGRAGVRRGALDRVRRARE